jgi:hypothetical protein
MLKDLCLVFPILHNNDYKKTESTSHEFISIGRILYYICRGPGSNPGNPTYTLWVEFLATMLFDKKKSLHVNQKMKI